ncbi:MAG: signal peptidase II [Acidobacteriota bacterium]
MKIINKKMLFLVPLLLVILDRVTKMLAVSYLQEMSRPVCVINGFFNLIFSTNRGALFGFLDALADPVRWIILTLIPLCVVLIIIVIMVRIHPDEKLLGAGMTLILGGAIGNLIDRILYGEVIDFLDFYLGKFHWPAFNLADSFISIGIALIFFDMIFIRSEKK